MAIQEEPIVPSSIQTGQPASDEHAPPTANTPTTETPPGQGGVSGQQARTTGGSGRTNAAPLLLSLYAEASLHPGTGQSSGLIDLPIQRERHTQFPTIPASSLKGSLRQAAEDKWKQGNAEIVNTLFGPPARGTGANGQSELYSGALAISDAQVVAFPVRSLSHAFVWITCPLVLGRLSRSLQLAGASAAVPHVSWPSLSETGPKPTEILVPSSARDNAQQRFRLPDMVVLEDLSFAPRNHEQWDRCVQWISRLLPQDDAHAVYRDKFSHHLTLIDDNNFSHLVQHATQVTARITLNERKTTTEDGGNLWYEETLPPDTLFAFLVRPEQPRVPRSAGSTPVVPDAEAVSTRFTELVGGGSSFLQVGGNETVGQGWCAVRVLNGSALSANITQ